MSERTFWVAFLAVLAIGVAACSGDDDDSEGDGDADADSDADTDADTDADGDCDSPAPAPDALSPGWLHVTFPTEGNAQATGQFSAEAVPPWHEETMREGDCRLLEYHANECDNCWNGRCIDGECIPYPEYLDAGTLTVAGLGADVRLSDQGGYYYAALEGRSLDPGAPVSVTASGAAFPAFEATSVQPAPMEADIENGEITIEDGTDEAVHWTPADPCTARVRLTLKSTTAAHGLPPNAMIECDVRDTGTLTIPSALIEAFPASSHQDICVLIDCPASTLARYTRAAVPAGENEAELLVESVRNLWVIH
jgi:hypothetical protein